MNNKPTFDQLPVLVYLMNEKLNQLQKTVENFAHKPSPNLVEDKKFMGDKELAAYLQCTIQTISKLKRDGKLPYHRFGRRYYYLQSEIDQAFKGKSI